MNNKIKRLVFFIAIFCFGFWGHVQTAVAKNKPEKVLKLRVTQAPPLYYKNSKGYWTGYDLTIIQRMAKRAGYAIELYEIPWKRGLAELKSGHIDIMMSLGKTFERSEHYDWIGPYRYEEMALIVRKKNADMMIETVADLEAYLLKSKKRVAVMLGTAFKNKDFMQLQNNKDLVFHIKDYQSSFDLLLKERVFAVAQLRVIANYYIDHIPGYMDLRAHSFTIDKSPVFFGVSKKAQRGVFESLNKAYQDLKAEGAFEDLSLIGWEK